MWIIVPLTFCPCAPVSADSTSASEWRSQMLEQSVLSRSKPLRAKSWQRAWKTKAWTKRLFGRIAPAITGGDGEIDGTERSTGGTIPSEQSSGTDYVADRDRTGFQKQCRAEPVCAEHEAVECGSCLPFPPAPEGNWNGIPAGLKPAICRMADGLAHRVDRIRACGNGVVPLAAAHAWGVLTTAANGGK